MMDETDVRDVAHELNNVIGVIGGYAELLLGVTTDEIARTDIERILRAVERGSALTRRLVT